MLDYGYDLKKSVAVRYPRGKGPQSQIHEILTPALELGKGRIIEQQDKDPNKIQVALLNFGSLLHFSLPLVKRLKEHNIQLTIADMRFIKPIDKDLIKTLAGENQYLFTLEDNAKMGGAGSAVNEVLCDFLPHPIIKNIALPDEFPEHATQQELYQQYQLDTEGLYKTIIKIIK